MANAWVSAAAVVLLAGMPSGARAQHQEFKLPPEIMKNALQNYVITEKMQAENQSSRQWWWWLLSPAAIIPIARLLSLLAGEDRPRTHQNGATIGGLAGEDRPRTHPSGGIDGISLGVDGTGGIWLRRGGI